MATVPDTTSAKPPFVNLVSGILDVLPQELGQICEDRTALLNSMFAELPSILSRALRCDVEKFREGIGLPPRQVSSGTSAADENKERQVHHLLLELVKLRRKEATLEVLLRALYVTDEETAIREVAERINNPDPQRAMPALTKRNLASVDSAFGSPSAQSHSQKDFVENEAAQTGLPNPVDTKVASAGLNGQPEITSLELSPGVALLEPKKETSHDTKAVQHVPQGDDDLHSEEFKQPMEESQLVSSAGHGGQSSVVAATVVKPHLTTALIDEEKQHVNTKYTDQRLNRLESHVAALEQSMKRMDEKHQQSKEKMEKTIKDMDQKHQSESLQQLKKNEHLETRNEELEAKLKELQLSVLELEKELKEVIECHKEALAKIAKLEEEKEELCKKNLQLESKNEALKMRIAETEREKATIQEIKEDLEKRNTALQSELEQQKENEETQRMAHEQSAQAAKDYLELELRIKNERIQRLEKLAQWNGAQVKEENKKLQEALAKIVKLEKDNENLRRLMSERDQNLEKVTWQQGAQVITDSHTGSGHLPQIICGNNSEKWRVVKSLGSGGYGEVVLAEQQGSGECHAIKKIVCKGSTSYEDQQENMESFLKELEVLKRCKHNRIVGYVDRFASSDKNVIYFYIVMEYMPLGSLDDVLKYNELEDSKVRKYTRQMLEGLEYLHANNIAHGDIKCANLLLDENEDIKLADFGCAKFLKSSASSDPGTLTWKVPERDSMEKREEKAAKEFDIWSVGVTVKKMLTGKKQLDDTKRMEIESPLGERELSFDAPGFSYEAKAFLQMCLTLEPSQRATLPQLLSSSFCSV